jgi:hypothetical protein
VALRAFRRVVARFFDKYRGWIVRLDCEHEYAINAAAPPTKRRRCLRCPVPPAREYVRVAGLPPWRHVVRYGKTKLSGEYTMLSCGHAIWGRWTMSKR